VIVISIRSEGKRVLFLQEKRLVCKFAYNWELSMSIHFQNCVPTGYQPVFRVGKQWKNPTSASSSVGPSPSWFGAGGAVEVIKKHHHKTMAIIPKKVGHIHPNLTSAI